MTNSLFQHAKCGGSLSLNLANLFTLRSPSIVIAATGLTPGVMELQERAKGVAVFTCSKCEKDVGVGSDEVAILCNVCRHPYPASQMHYADQLPGVCSECLDMLSGKKAPSGEAMKIADYILLSRDGIVFIKFSDVLRKPVRLNVPNRD